MSKATIKWIDHGREPQCAPNPAYPNGIDINLTNGQRGCRMDLPYPAKRIGLYLVQCKKCGARVAVTTAGRPDDPRSVKVLCRRN